MLDRCKVSGQFLITNGMTTLHEPIRDCPSCGTSYIDNEPRVIERIQRENGDRVYLNIVAATLPRECGYANIQSQSSAPALREMSHERAGSNRRA